MPYFSIVVPVYNVAPYLREALDSVLAQTFKDWECLCVDDGSTDGSSAILDEYVVKDNRFKVWHKENGGVSSARNLALDHAQGEWLCFLDGDDVFHFQLLENLFPLTKKDAEVDIVSYSYKHGPQILFSRQKIFPIKIEMLDLQDWIPSKVLTGGFSEKIYRRNRFLKLRFNILLKRAEDRLFSGEAICQVRKVITTDYTGYWYRTREGSAMQSPDTIEKVRNSFEAASSLLKLFCSSIHRIDPSVIRGKCVLLSEATSCRLALLPNSLEKKRFIEDWSSSLREFSTYKISLWFRKIFMLVGIFPCLRHVFFTFPYKLKLIRNTFCKKIRVEH